MTINKEYEAKKQALLESYDLLMLCEHIDNKDDIKLQKEQLKQEKLIISICGAIKTGKTTLLNYLLFNGEEMLPVDVTPETAKLAKISKGSSKHAEVHFLSKAEWDEYKNTPDAKEDPEIAETLANLKISDYIHDTPFSIKLYDLKDLTNYISKKSVLSPLVKNADIYIDEKVMDNIVVVDTPGLNDPCKARSEVTLNWVNKTDAMIYIMNTKQAFTKQDVDFLDEYCSHIAPEKIIIVLGQIDRANFQEVQKYIKNMSDSEDFSKRNYLKNHEPFPVSVMAAMLNKYPKKVEHAKFYQDKISPDLVKEEGYMPVLEKAINSSLMKSKGNSILNSHRNKVYSLLRDTISQIDDEIEIYKDKLDNYGKSKNEIEKKRISVEKIAQSIKEENENFEDDFDRIFLQDVENFITHKFEKERQDTIKYYETQCHNNWKKFYICLANTPVYFRERIKNTVSSVLFDNSMSQFRNQINSIYEETYNKLKLQMDDCDLCYRKFKKPILDLQKIHDRIDEMVNVELQKNILNNQRKTILFLFTKQKKSIQNLIGVVDKVIVKLYRVARVTTINEIQGDIRKQKDKYVADIMKYQEAIKGNLTDITDNLIEREKESDKIKGVINEKEDQLHEVQLLESEISTKLSNTFGE